MLASRLRTFDSSRGPPKHIRLQRCEFGARAWLGVCQIGDRSRPRGGSWLHVGFAAADGFAAAGGFAATGGFAAADGLGAAGGVPGSACALVTMKYRMCGWAVRTTSPTKANVSLAAR